jgi:hypothetical protein
MWLACLQQYSVSWSLLPTVGEGREKRDEIGEETKMKMGGENNEMGEERTLCRFFFLKNKNYFLVFFFFNFAYLIYLWGNFT